MKFTTTFFRVSRQRLFTYLLNFLVCGFFENFRESFSHKQHLRGLEKNYANFFNICESGIYSIIKIEAFFELSFTNSPFFHNHLHLLLVLPSQRKIFQSLEFLVAVRHLPIPIPTKFNPSATQSSSFNIISYIFAFGKLFFLLNFFQRFFHNFLSTFLAFCHFFFSHKSHLFLFLLAFHFF